MPIVWGLFLQIFTKPIVEIPDVVGAPFLLHFATFLLLLLDQPELYDVVLEVTPKTVLVVLQHKVVDAEPYWHDLVGGLFRTGVDQLGVQQVLQVLLLRLVKYFRVFDGSDRLQPLLPLLSALDYVHIVVVIVA